MRLRMIHILASRKHLIPFPFIKYVRAYSGTVSRVRRLTYLRRAAVRVVCVSARAFASTLPRLDCG